MRMGRKIVAALSSVVLAATLVACGITGGSSPLTNYLDKDTVEFMQNWDLYTPTSLTYTQLFETSKTYGNTDLATMRSVHDALMKLKVGKEVSERVTDKSEIFTFALPSGKSFFVEFENHHLLTGGKAYEVSDDADLWALADTMVKSSSSDGLARDTKEGTELINADTAEAPASSSASGTSGSGSGSASSTATSGSASGTSSGTETGASGQTGDGSGLVSASAEAASDAGSATTPQTSSQPRQWMEPMGETTDGRGIETMVVAN